MQDGYISIMDIEGYTNDNMNLDGLKKTYPIFGNYFPDVLKKMYIINVSYMAKMLYRTAELFIHEVTRKKVS